MQKSRDIIVTQRTNNCREKTGAAIVKYAAQMVQPKLSRYFSSTAGRQIPESTARKMKSVCMNSYWVDTSNRTNKIHKQKMHGLAVKLHNTITANITHHTVFQ